jgi:hypothetical protein
MAAYLAGSQLLMAPRLYQELRFHPHLERFGPAAAPIAGAAFGLAWTPCIGPILGTVLNFAAQGRDITRAAILLGARQAGRNAERVERMRKTIEVQHDQLDAASRRPRDRDELARRMRDGTF